MKNLLRLFFINIFILAGLLVFTPQTYAQSPRVYVANSGSNTVSVVDSGTNNIIHTISVGASPRGLIVSPDKSRVYVSNYSDDTVSVIDSSDYSTVTTIAVGDGPTGMAITRNGTKLYVSDFDEDKVSVIDTTTNTVVDTITVAANPWNMTMTADGSRLYVSSGSSSSVAAIDTVTNTVLSSTYILHGSGIAVTPDGSRLYVGNGGEGTVQVFDTSDMSEITTITVSSGNPTGKIAMNLSGTRAVVSLNGTASVGIIDVTNNTLVTTVAVGTEPNGVAFTPNGEFAYIGNNSSNTVSVIDMSTNTVVDTLSVGANPIAVEVESAGSYQIYVGNQGGNTVSVINSDTNTVSSNVTTGNQPYAIAVSPDGLRTYVVNLQDDSVSVVDTPTNSVIHTISVGHTPGNIFIDPSGLHIYVTISGPNYVDVINTQTYASDKHITIGDAPGHGRMSPDGSRLYIANYYGNSISVIDTTSNDVIDTITGDWINPGSMAITPDGSKLYVAASVTQVTNYQTLLIDIATHDVLDTIDDLSGVPQGSMVMTPNGHYIYVLASQASSVKVLNTQTGTVIDSIAVGSGPTGSIVTPDGTTVYVTNINDNNVSVIDTASNTVIETISVGVNPGPLGVGIVPPMLIQAINAGGSTAGNFVDDTGYTGGQPYSSSSSVDTSGVTNPAPEAVYQSVRYGNFTYTISDLTPDASYTVRLHFNELYWNSAGSRVFNVSVNGNQELTNYDIYNAAGGANKAVVEQIQTTADENGDITIQFTTVTDNAMVNGIELYSGTLPTPTPVTSKSINAGGSSVGSFVADTDYSGGQGYSTTASVDTSGVTSPAPEAVYQSVRYGNFTYTIPNLVPNSSHTLRLHFNELYWNSAGSRVFNVTVNGNQELTNYDIYQVAGGGDKAVIEEFPVTADSNGFVTIQFTTVTDNAMVNGIEIN